jgi:hypothetical protein
VNNVKNSIKKYNTLAKELELNLTAQHVNDRLRTFIDDELLFGISDFSFADNGKAILEEEIRVIPILKLLKDHNFLPMLPYKVFGNYTTIGIFEDTDYMKVYSNSNTLIVVYGIMSEVYKDFDFSIYDQLDESVEVTKERKSDFVYRVSLETCQHDVEFDDFMSTLKALREKCTIKK